MALSYPEDWVDEAFPHIADAKGELTGSLEYQGAVGSYHELGNEHKPRAQNGHGRLNVDNLDLQPSELQEKLQDHLELHQQSASEANSSAESRRPGGLQSVLNYWNPFGFLGYFRKEKHSGEGDDWEVPFEDIRDLEFIGSGSQGAWRSNG